MTERLGEVESPLAQARVQRLVAAVVVLFALGMGLSSVSSHRRAGGPSNCRPEGIQIDLNEADLKELSLVPGVGPVLARRIVADRDRHGDYLSVDELERVHGIGPKTLLQVKQLCFVDDESIACVGVETATDATIEEAWVGATRVIQSTPPIAKNVENFAD